MTPSKLQPFNIFRFGSRYNSSQRAPSTLKAYSPVIEAPLAERWKDEKVYSSCGSIATDSPVFSMILPPPNVTGTLHLGHALTVAVGDAICRWHRMKGHRVLWIPGTDHAGIATQAVVERDLLSRKLTRRELGREKFVDEVWKWKNSRGNRINDQLNRLGASLDWTREYFTLDKSRSDAVTQALIKLWDAGLVYRSESLVNWCCSLRSAISDIEIDHLSLDGPTQLSVPGYDTPVTFGQLEYFAYKVYDSENEVIVATTRLETMLGDVAVAVHPADERYYDVHGKYLVHPFTNEHIPIVLDDKVDPKFGTGAVKITPAHDATDFEIRQRHNLKTMSIILEDGTLSEHCGDFANMKRFEARESIRKVLSCMGLFKKIEPHQTNLPICSRSGDVIELLMKPQWFIKCDSMAKKARHAVESGEMVIQPEKHNKIWFSWLDNIKDWCISRQLWWGHQVPFYRCTNGKDEIWVAAWNDDDALRKAQKTIPGDLDVQRDSDVLDTWFSSALLPFSSLNWPNQDEHFEQCYPLSCMVTGHDILFFWVARMSMLGLELTGKIPFKEVFLHSIVCDSNGKKMSKSLGNIIDPMDIINGCSLEMLNSKTNDSVTKGVMSKDEAKKAHKTNKTHFPNGIPQCGADALRFSLLSQNIKSHFINFNHQDCHGYKLFCNKIWQGHKFAHLWHDKLMIDNEQTLTPPQSNKFIDNWILSELSSMVITVNEGLTNKDFHHCTLALRKFLYSYLCDVYIEAIKPILNSTDKNQAQISCLILLHCFDVALRCLEPFMPFLSETLYSTLAHRSFEYLESACFPVDAKFQNQDAHNKMEYALSIIHMIRKVKSEKQVVYKPATVYITTDCSEYIQDLRTIMNTLSRSECILVEKHHFSDYILEGLLEGIVDDSTRIYVDIGTVKQIVDKSV